MFKKGDKVVLSRPEGLSAPQLGMLDSVQACLPYLIVSGMSRSWVWFEGSNTQWPTERFTHYVESEKVIDKPSVDLLTAVEREALERLRLMIGDSHLGLCGLDKLVAALDRIAPKPEPVGVSFVEALADMQARHEARYRVDDLSYCVETSTYQLMACEKEGRMIPATGPVNKYILAKWIKIS